MTMPGLNQPIDAFPRMAKMAEDAGFDSVWDYEFYRNPLVIHGMTAQATSTIPLGTGLVTTAGRSPFVMANAAADVDEASGGRLILGISTGAAAFTDLMNGADSNRPAARTREYVTLLRKIWDWTAGDGVADGETFGGEFYKFTAPEINPFGRRPLERKRIPIYTAALRQTMCRLAGEISDGVIGFMLPPGICERYTCPASKKERTRQAATSPTSTSPVRPCVACQTTGPRPTGALASKSASTSHIRCAPPLPSTWASQRTARCV